MNRSELIETKQNFITKIKMFFRKVFVRNYKNETINVNNNTLIKKSSINDNQKEQFFDLYNKIKHGEVNAFDVDANKLKKICRMLEEECKLKEMKLKNTREEIEIHRQNVMCYKKIANS